MHTVEHGIAQVEQLLNYIDWIPGISSFSGMIRILAGEVQVAAGVALAALKVFYIVLTGNGNYLRAIGQGLTYSLHGLGNISRGMIALISIVNLLLYVYDKRIGRMNYEGEIMKLDVYPIMTAHQW